MDSPRPRPERDQTDESLRAERKNTDGVLAETCRHVEDTVDEVLERARSDEALAHRDDFLGIISHDLRNLLGAVAAGSTFHFTIPPSPGSSA